MAKIFVTQQGQGDSAKAIVIGGGIVFLMFYSLFVSMNYSNVKDDSRRRLYDGSYTPEKEITEFTSAEFMQMFTAQGALEIAFLSVIIYSAMNLSAVFIQSDKLDNLFSKSKSLVSSDKEATVKGLGILVGSLVIIWGVFVLGAQTEYNDSVDNLNEVYDENEEVYEAAGVEKPDAEKEYGAYVWLGVGIVIFLFYLSRS